MSPGVGFDSTAQGNKVIRTSRPTMQCNAMQCNAMQRNAMQCNATQCNATQCIEIQCNAMQCKETKLSTDLYLNQIIKRTQQSLERADLQAAQCSKGLPMGVWSICLV